LRDAIADARLESFVAEFYAQRQASEQKA
jgi:hypothetical protein